MTLPQSSELASCEGQPDVMPVSRVHGCALISHACNETGYSSSVSRGLLNPPIDECGGLMGISTEQSAGGMAP